MSVITNLRDTLKSPLFLKDALLITIMAVLAGCGLIYEYLLSHYAGRILGSVETAIFAMIGIMIVAMGVGAFAAKLIKEPFTAFAGLEVVVALLGATSVVVIASIVGFTAVLPQTIAEIFGLPVDMQISGGIFQSLHDFAVNTPYFMGFILGFLLGMEIPLIARIRERLHGEHLANNVGTVYGADYIGAGIGAAIWVMVLLSMDVTQAAVVTASANLIAGLAFLIFFADYIKRKIFLYSLHGFLVVVLILVYQFGIEWNTKMSNTLFMDQVVYNQNTKYQHLTVTKRNISLDKPAVYGLYINGRLQFSSEDEHIYHSMLVYPAMAASARHDKVLIIGGGDGLALRNVLRWQPQQVQLIDLDEQLIALFTDTGDEASAVKQAMLAINEESFSDKRVKVTIGDAFIEINKLLAQEQRFDTIIVDLPDPSHPDLNKLYSDHFYGRLKHLLAGDGALVVQSTSPYHASKAFKSIGKTVKAAGFANVQQYHQNVPSFGEWGWTIAVMQGQSVQERLSNLDGLPVQDEWVTKGLMLAAFEFPASYYQALELVEVNKLGSHKVYQYHHQAWSKDQAVLHY